MGRFVVGPILALVVARWIGRHRWPPSPTWTWTVIAVIVAIIAFLRLSFLLNDLNLGDPSE
jgi:uncharacterized membrane protein YoaK (UPF0700 family)